MYIPSVLYNLVPELNHLDCNFTQNNSKLE